MPDNKLISVCINVYNSEKTIKETLESVVNQTYKNLQIIVVDDCSTDNSVEVIKSVKDDRIELYCLAENGNISNCNNEAISHARGEYIAHLDSDDVWLPDKLEKQYAFMEANSEYGACFSHMQSIDEDGNSLGEQNYYETVYNINNMSQAEFIRFFYDNANRLCHCAILIRKAVQDEIGLHDLSYLYLHDYDMWVRLVIKYPIYIYPEPLVKIRIRQGSNSSPSKEKTVAHNEEFARITYKLINDCPDGLFLEAFKDKLRYSGEHSKTDVELEKAFVLLDAFLPLKSNKSLGIHKFDTLFSDKETVRIAKEHFDFSLQDFYDLHKNEIYFDKSLNDDYIRASEELNESFARLSEELDEVTRKKDIAEQESDLEKLEICSLNDRIGEMSDGYAELARKYDIMGKSRPIRYTKALRGISTFFNLRKFLKTTKHPDGRNADAKIVMFGYFGHNLGDDMFFDILFRRYPNTLFCFSHTSDYAKFASKYNNVRFVDINESRFKRLDAIGAKLGKESWSEKLLYSSSDAAIHIGGSIYQQIADWQIDIEQRKRRNAQFRDFFTVSNNFGPYSTDDYRLFWENEFTTYSDVCFRDIYSYSLFSNIDRVRYAPDLLFSFRDVQPVEVEKRVAISVINPWLPVRSFTEQQAQQYEQKIIELINYYVGREYEVSLMDFCSLEQDAQEIEKLWLELKHEVREKVSLVHYKDDYRVITNEIKKSEIVIATRFHAMILGYVLGKKVLPICYSNKVINVINDLSLTANPLTFDTLAKFSAKQLDKKTNSLAPERIAALREDADSQFDALDKFILSKRGTVIKP